MNTEDLQQEEAKCRRLAAEMRLAAAALTCVAGTFDDDTDMGDDDENNGAAVMLPMTYEQLTEVKLNYTCFACKCINAGSMRENPEFVKLMKLYTENAEAVRQPALFRLVEAHFDRHCRPIVQEEWTLPCIEEHFAVYTHYPTDEILKQLGLLTSTGNNMISTALLRNVRNNVVEPLNNNIKNLVII